jgi:hypothetical protein
MYRKSQIRSLRGFCRSRDFPPDLESLCQLVAVVVGGEQVASRSAVLGNRPIRREKALGVPWRFEAPHAAFTFACRLMRILGAIGEVAVLSMFDARQELTLRRPMALQRIGDEHPWDNRLSP